MSVFGGRNAQKLDGSPELAAAAAAFCELLGKSVEEICAGAAVSLSRVTEGKLSSVLGEKSSFGVVLSAKGSKIPGDVLFYLDAVSVDAWVDRLLGGEGQAARARSLTTVDVRLCKLLLEKALTLFAESMRDMGKDVGLQMDELASDPGKIGALRSIDGVTVIEVAIGPPPAAITLRIVIPEAMGAGLMDGLEKPKPAAAGAPPDRSWAALIERHVAQTTVNLSAVLDSSTVDLGDVINWQVGQMVPLTAIRGALVSLEGAGMPLAQCELGRQADRLVLRVWSTTEPVDGTTELAVPESVSPGQAGALIIRNVA